MPVPIIATGTTYPPRIGTYDQVLQSLVNQSLPFDKIVVNLDKESFDEMFLDGAKEHFSDISDKIEVNIVNRNTKTMKKVLPTADKYGNCFIFSFDDDIIYKPNTLETFFNKAKSLHFDYSITCGDYFYGRGVEAVGRGTLFMPDFFLDYRYYPIEDDIRVNHDDLFIAYMAKAIHKRFAPLRIELGHDLGYQSSGDYWNNSSVFEYYGKRFLRMCEIAEVLEARYEVENETGELGLPCIVDEPSRYNLDW